MSPLPAAAAYGRTPVVFEGVRITLAVLLGVLARRREAVARGDGCPALALTFAPPKFGGYAASLEQALEAPPVTPQPLGAVRPEEMRASEAAASLLRTDLSEILPNVGDRTSQSHGDSLVGERSQDLSGVGAAAAATVGTDGGRLIARSRSRSRRERKTTVGNGLSRRPAIGIRLQPATVM
eukprot:COSAG01_NODE_13794_length_1534_cov_1.902439_2_plen_181_part_00